MKRQSIIDYAQCLLDRYITGYYSSVVWKIVLGISATFVLAAGAALLILTGVLASPVPVRIGPAPADLCARSVEFGATNSGTVKGWWCVNDNGSTTVLLLPGIRANRLSMIGRARFLKQVGYSVLLIDLQGTGETDGEHITFGWKESRDVVAAVEFIRQARPNDKVAIIGSSLGGAAALLAAPPLKVDALVLEAVYPTIEIAVRNRLKKYLGSVGAKATPLLVLQLRPRLGVRPADLRPVGRIGDVGCPVFLINGEFDRNTTVQDAFALYNAARSPKELWIVPHVGHVDLHTAVSQEYERRIVRFLRGTRSKLEE